MQKKISSKKNIIIAISVLLTLFFKYIPSPQGMNQSSMQVLGVFLGALLLWITISIDWPSLLAILGLSLIPELNLNEILKVSFGGSTFSFLLFTFMCTYAISQTSFVKRCAVFFITGKFSQKGPWWFLISYCLSVLILGTVMSPTVLYVIYMPILEEICNLLELKQDDKLANALVLGQTFSCSISCGMTPIAHVFSIMAIGFYEAATNKTITYLKYMGFAIPVGIISFVLMILVFKIFLKPDMKKFKNFDVSTLKKESKPFDKREKIIISIFFLVVLMWILPEFFVKILPSVNKFFKAGGMAFPPLIGAVLLFMISIDEKPLLDFKEVMSKGISWPSLIMTASTLAIGFAMTNKDIGLVSWISEKSEPILNNLSPMVLVFFIVLWASIQTNLSSNMVTVTVVCAVAIPICIAGGNFVSTPAIASIIGMTGSFAFATPPSHPNVALAGSSGFSTAAQVMKYGIIMMVITILATVFVGYPLAAKIMGL